MPSGDLIKDFSLRVHAYSNPDAFEALGEPDRLRFRKLEAASADADANGVVLNAILGRNGHVELRDDSTGQRVEWKTAGGGDCRRRSGTIDINANVLKNPTLDDSKKSSVDPESITKDLSTRMPLPATEVTTTSELPSFTSSSLPSVKASEFRGFRASRLPSFKASRFPSGSSSFADTSNDSSFYRMLLPEESKKQLIGTNPSRPSAPLCCQDEGDHADHQMAVSPPPPKVCRFCCWKREGTPVSSCYCYCKGVDFGSM